MIGCQSDFADWLVLTLLVFRRVLRRRDVGGTNNLTQTLMQQQQPQQHLAPAPSFVMGHSKKKKIDRGLIKGLLY